MDLIVADKGARGQTGYAAVLLGNGNGTFQSPLTFAAGNAAGADDFVFDTVPGDQITGGQVVN